MCLRFWYWRHTNEHNTIDVLTVSPATTKIVWTSQFFFPTKTWHRAQVEIFMVAGTKITIRAKHLGEFKDQTSLKFLPYVIFSRPGFTS